MAEDFLGEFLGNSARARILRVFVLNQDQSYTLRQLARRAGISARVAQKEIRRLERWGIVKKGKFQITVARSTRTVKGRQKEQLWATNSGFKHAGALSKFVHEISPVHYATMLSKLKRAGRLSAVIVSGTFMGDSSRPADLVVVFDTHNEARLDQAIRSLEPKYGREIRYAPFSTPEFRYRLTIHDRLLRDTLDFPHLVLLDRSGLL